MMRRALVAALACAALLPAQAVAAPTKAVIVHLQPGPMPAAGRLGARGRQADRARGSKRAQAPVLAQLAELRREGHVRHVRSLWIASAVALTADDSALAALRARPDVRSIEADSELPIEPADAVTGEPGIALTGAPAFWARGVDGTGITVGILDTGVDLTHPELALRYRGGSNSWFDPYGEHPDAPVDVGLLAGHGTQVTGVVVAGGGIGMAPGARFIAARAFDDAGTGLPSGIHARLPVAARPRRRSEHQRRAERRQPLVGRTAGLQSRIPARPAGAARRAHPPGGGRRERRCRSPGRGQLARQPARGVRSRRTGERNDDRTVLEPRSLELRRRPVPRARRPREPASARPASAESTRRAHGDLVLGAARRGRAGAAAPGRPAAHRGPAGDAAHAERHRPRRAGSRLHVRRRAARPRRGRAAAPHPRARLRPSRVVGRRGRGRDAPAPRR